MTDSSSEDMHMAQELMEAKMALGQARNQMTHMLRMGNFHIEIVPNKDIDIEKFFTIDNIFLYYYMNNLFANVIIFNQLICL